MGTSYSIKINHNKFFKDSKLKIKIENELNYISSVFSTYDNKSELSLINKSNKNSFTISDDMMIVLVILLYLELMEKVATTMANQMILTLDFHLNTWVLE